jgi:two-component system nitrogen regulation sensor histidine kinase NtrY
MEPIELKSIHLPDGPHGFGDGVDLRERKKRRREVSLIVLLVLLFAGLTGAEFHLSTVSRSLPFVNSIFFFGLLNFNIILVIALVWLISRNIGKLFIERRRKVLGSRLKTKLVIAFLAFSLVPTLVLFLISALYINSSFDKWFSLKVQNTLEASLEITRTYYRNLDQTASHFGEQVAGHFSKQFFSVVSTGEGSPPPIPTDRWMEFLGQQRQLLALDALEFYSAPLSERLISERPDQILAGQRHFPRVSLDLLDQAFRGERVSVMQHVGSGDLIRCLVPVRGPLGDEQKSALGGAVRGVLVVDSFIPLSLVNRVGEIASVFDDYKETNPLKYPMKTTYLVILVMITLVITLVAVWIGFYLARELTVPVERLVHAAEEVGSGNLDVAIKQSGHDELAVLVQSFNKMTSDLRENQWRLKQAGADLERRRLQLEAVLAQIGTGVLAMDQHGVVVLFNEAAGQLLHLRPQDVLGRSFQEALKASYSEASFQEMSPLLKMIHRTLQASLKGVEGVQESLHWSLRLGDSAKTLAATATPLVEGDLNWGVVLVMDDMTHRVKSQREMAWREVARRIAHEIKNPLTPIKLSAQRMQRRVGHLGGRDGAIIQECTDTIIKHTDELKDMVNEFSNFARFPEASPAPHDLNRMIQEVLTLFRQAHPQVQFAQSLEVRLPIFEFDRDQMKRVLLNLLDNAVSAFDDQGNSGIFRRIRVATHYNDQLQMAVVEVEDNGPGMSDEVKARVFEPYFSTKSEGTGLGLAIAKRIVNDHDGFIRVRSAPGQGTLFLIELPTVHLNEGVRNEGFSQDLSH